MAAGDGLPIIPVHSISNDDARQLLQYTFNIIHLSYFTQNRHKTVQ